MLGRLGIVRGGVSFEVSRYFVAESFILRLGSGDYCIMNYRWRNSSVQDARPEEREKVSEMASAIYAC